MPLCDYNALEQHQMIKRRLQCQDCDRLLRTENGLEEHRQAVHSHLSLTYDKDSTRKGSLPLHCKECDRFFPHAGALADHRSAHHSNPCPICDQVDFTSYASFQAFKRSTGHSFCRDCDLRSSASVTEFRCCDCDQNFANEPALQQHLTTEVHAPPLRCERVCKECDREFANEMALLQHQSSVVHRPLSNIQCMAHKKCKKRFGCPSALLHHLESGSCRSKMTRWKLNKAVREKDIDCLITCDDGVLVEMEPEILGTEYSSSPLMGSIVFTPDTSTNGSSTPGQFTELQSSHLPFVLKISCPLCPNRKAFHSVQALQSHLSSPVHAPKMFHCPLSLTPSSLSKTEVWDAMKHFSTLSGLTQHIESGACVEEIVMLKKAVECVERKLKEAGWRGLRLLDS